MHRLISSERKPRRVTHTNTCRNLATSIRKQPKGRAHTNTGPNQATQRKQEVEGRIKGRAHIITQADIQPETRSS